MNNEVNNNNSNETEITSNNTNMYTLLVANKTGHDTLTLDIDQAIDNITELVETKKNWVFINGAPFEFAGSSARSEANISKLRTQLEQNPNAQVMLTGQVIGGDKQSL
jgi:RNase H-fold protein (predicted Holliday junction resolvase)